MGLIPCGTFAQQGDSSIPEKTLRTLDSHAPFTFRGDLASWKKRKEQLTLQLRVALGVFPEPRRTPLNPVEHSPIDQGDYIVSHVYFESLPGYYVTGNLYRPKNLSAPSLLSCAHMAIFLTAGLPKTHQKPLKR
ncbi:MAG: hypothetical protein R3C03_02130 [Pirellulaceae bacterium]